VEQVPAKLVELADLLLASVREVQKAVLYLHDPKKHQEAMAT
jgi:hypothetical protein